MRFYLVSDNKNPRKGLIETPHGSIKTPFFMPVGTVGSVKGVSPDELLSIGFECLLSNTYHLFLRPGEKNIKKLGGLHAFMGWDRAILTDSGGYQVFSLAKNQLKTKNSKLKTDDSLVKITPDGVEFKSHLDGTKRFFTPEKVVQIQLDLGVDMIMPLDVCPSGKATKKEVESAVELTIKWAKRSKEYFDKKIQDIRNLPFQKVGKKQTNLKSQISKKLNAKNYLLKAVAPLQTGRLKAGKRPGLFAIVQGGLNIELRKHCAKKLIKMDFDAYAIGGLAVDLETREMWGVVKLMGAILPEEKPRYLMGVGTPNDIIKAISLGIDMFDCVLPTRLARHGTVFVKKQKSEIRTSKTETLNSKKNRINLLSSKYRSDNKVIETGCGCYACTNGFSRAYIAHLIREREMFGMRLATLHNLYKYKEIVDKVGK